MEIYMLKITTILLKFVSLILGISETQSFPPALSPKEERELFEKMHQGVPSARAKLIEHNLRLVSHIIRKYYAAYEDPEELLSIGSLGLIKAIDSFKHEYGTRFATYGARCVQNEILMFFRSSKRNMNEISINETIDIDKDGNPLTYLDIISIEENFEDEIELRQHTARIMQLVESVLDGREREIIVMRYGLGNNEPKTQREVARMLGISRSYVSRIEKKALEALRRSYGPCKPEFDL